MADLTIPQEAVEAAGLALGKALAAATYLDGGEEYVDWGEWHPCEQCPRPEIGKRGCAELRDDMGWCWTCNAGWSATTDEIAITLQPDGADFQQKLDQLKQALGEAGLVTGHQQGVSRSHPGRIPGEGEQ